MPSELESLLEMARRPGSAGHRALGRLIRMVDDELPGAEEIDEAVKSTAFRGARFGLTGPPGAGKSSLIAAALEVLSTSKKKIGVLAVDPTSPFTGGALLGDRVRLRKAPGDNVFFRSLASRGASGGISRAIWQASRLLDWWGADIILIETVGSGQLGTGVADVADLVAAVLTPETGDGIQSMKAGIMELADCFIVNKCDRPGADLLFRELAHTKHEAEKSARQLEVFKTNAIDNEGVAEAVAGIAALWNQLNVTGGIALRRQVQVKREIAVRVEEHIRSQLMSALGGRDVFEGLLSDLAARVLQGETTPVSAAKSLDKHIEKSTGYFFLGP